MATKKKIIRRIAVIAIDKKSLVRTMSINAAIAFIFMVSSLLWISIYFTADPLFAGSGRKKDAATASTSNDDKDVNLNIFELLLRPKYNESETTLFMSMNVDNTITKDSLNADFGRRLYGCLYQLRNVTSLKKFKIKYSECITNHKPYTDDENSVDLMQNPEIQEFDSRKGTLDDKPIVNENKCNPNKAIGLDEVKNYIVNNKTIVVQLVQSAQTDYKVWTVIPIFLFEVTTTILFLLLAITFMHKSLQMMRMGNLVIRHIRPRKNVADV